MDKLTEVDFSVILTIQTGINEPWHASLRGIRQAQREPIDDRLLADPNVDGGRSHIASN